MSAALLVTASCTSTYQPPLAGTATTTHAPVNAAPAPRGAAAVTTVARGAATPARPITGRLLSADGAPMAGTAVRLDENRGLANDLFGGVFVLFTAGLSCFAGADPCRPSGGAGATTGPDGAFRFDTAAVERARGRSNGVILSAGATLTGGVRAKVDPTLGGDLGDLALWAPKVRAGTDGFDVRFDAKAPPGADSRTEVDARLLDAQGRSVVDDTETGADVTFVVDRRAYEDGPGTVVLASGFSRPRAGQNPRIDWTSAPVRVGTGAGAPLSRGRPCAVDLSGRVPPAGCPLTDGDLVTDSVSGLRSAVIDLGSARPLGLIAVRSVAESVEISADGQAYAPLARASSPAAAWSAALYDSGGRHARFVRITVIPGTGSEPQGVAEVSVWAADARAPAEPARPTPGSSVVPLGAGGIMGDPPAPMAQPLDGDGAADRSPVVVPGVIAAGLLLTIAAFAAGTAIGRRRHS